MITKGLPKYISIHYAPEKGYTANKIGKLRYKFKLFLENMINTFL